MIRGADTVLTFDPHPLAVIHPEATPKLISTSAVKRDLIAGLGVEELVVIPFDKGFSSQTAEEFVGDVLIDRLGAEKVSVGENFRFGRGAKGTPEFLREHDEFETRVVPLVEAAGETISSSHIRGLVAAGEVGPGGRVPGRAVPVRGRGGPRRPARPRAGHADRQPGAGRGASWCPGHGVYAAWAHGYPAAVNVGVRPTFETGRGLLVEAHLIGFEGDLYGETLRIAFLDRLRGEKRFESVDELVEQMNRDVEDAKRIAEATREA